MDKRENKTSKLLLLWYSYPRVAVGLILLAINLAVIALFTVILSLIKGNGVFGELSYLFTYTMCSDGIYDFVNNKEDVYCFIIKIVLTVIQMVIFSGALIGFTTDIIQNMFDNRLENKGKMNLKNHFVFLNWSTIGQNIIHDLSYLEGDKTVVILTEEEREDVINSIDNIFTATGRSKKGLRVFVKKGDPTSSKHLEDISISDAKHVGILLPNHENYSNGDISTNDLTAFKLMLTMLGEAPKANIVVETENETAKLKIEQLIDSTHPHDKTRVSVFSHNAVMGHVLGRTTVNSLFAPLFLQILSFNGVEFYGVPTMNVEEALYSYDDCIPIINYDDDDFEDADGKKADQLYILSDTHHTLGTRLIKNSFVKPLDYEAKFKPEDFTLFIFSDSTRAQFVATELENTNKVYNTNIKYQVFSYKDSIDDIIEKIKQTDGKCKLLLLSEEKKDVEEQDTEVFMFLLHLKTSEVIKNDVEIYVELVNIDNMIPVRNLGIASVILTNKLISLYMLQLMTHRESRRFFKDVLLTNSDFGVIDFEIAPAKDLLKFNNTSIDFSCYSELVQSFYIASNRTKMIVGRFITKDEIEFFCNKMDKNDTITITPDDQLIMINYK